MNPQQTIEQRLARTANAMRRSNQVESGIDLCHIVAVDDAIAVIKELREDNATWRQAMEDELAETLKLIEALGVAKDIEAGASSMDAMLGKIAELKRLSTPNMFWEEDCDGDNAVDDPTDIADNLDIGCVFSLMCARSLPDAYFVAGVDERGCTTATPASDEQIAEYKAAKKAERDRRQAEFARRNAESGAVRAVPFPTPEAAEAAAGVKP